ncbi:MULTISPECIES: siroheme synthase [unclassified Novosphingobium]|uniref:precorrin-2 dehydrogenase/sirohydrochlorin ferrochelatase family protein n=1 Tax=unclassified Novosphingobium TaxID=2644732 RepID=UPI000EE0B4BD|nr:MULTISPECIES: siroheme synthase [unclassified Novosphingobium]HCF25546.1 siroheme synthase [Novosphingobium sp.]HQV03876.1 siroheme synthase [Novosphingobium sp.]
MHSLPLFHRLGGRKVILLAEGEAGEAKRRLLERAGAEIVGEDDGAARLCFIALDEPEAAAQRLRAKGLLLNVTDRPDLCDFTVPSILERGPVLVAVGTGGASAGLAKALRLRLEALLPASLGTLAERLQQARGAMRQRFPEPGQRRRALDAALSEGGALDPLFGASADAVAGWLDGGEAGEGGTVEFSISSADPDDLTLRQARWLGAADFVAYEDRVSSEILARARADAVRLQIGAGERLSPRPGLTVIIRRG